MSSTTPKVVSNTIKTLNSSKSKGPNSISTKIIKTIKDEILISLSNLLDKFFNTGIFLNICKLTRVIPILKSEARQLFNNYRPISLLSNICKMIEKLMHRRLKTNF